MIKQKLGNQNLDKNIYDYLNDNNQRKYSSSNNKTNNQKLLNKPSDLDNFKKQAIAKIYAGEPLTGENGIFSDMIKDILEAALDGEMEQHLSNEKQEF